MKRLSEGREGRVVEVGDGDQWRSCKGEERGIRQEHNGALDVADVGI